MEYVAFTNRFTKAFRFSDASRYTVAADKIVDRLSFLQLLFSRYLLPLEIQCPEDFLFAVILLTSFVAVLSNNRTFLFRARVFPLFMGSLNKLGLNMPVKRAKVIMVLHTGHFKTRIFPRSACYALALDKLLLVPSRRSTLFFELRGDALRVKSANFSCLGVICGG